MCYAKYPEKRPVKTKANVPPKYPSSRSKAATNLLLTLRKNVNDLLSAEDEDATLVEDELRFASSPNIVAFPTKDFDRSLASLNKALPSENLRLLPARCRMELPQEVRKTQSENQQASLVKMDRELCKGDQWV